MNDWDPWFDKPRIDHIWIKGTVLRPGKRVRVQPLGRADILDLVLAGKTGTIEVIERDLEERVYLGVVQDLVR